MGRKVARRNKRATLRLEKSGSPKKRWQKSSWSSDGGGILVSSVFDVFCSGGSDFWVLPPLLVF